MIAFLRRFLSRQTPEATDAVERAITAFFVAYRDERAKDGGVRAVEDDRFIVETYYGVGRPCPRSG